MRTRLAPVLPALQTAPDRMLRISFIIQDQIGMPALTLQPAPHSVLLLLKSLSHRQLGSRTIAVGRRRRNVPLLFEARSQLLVAASHVLLQNVSAAGFVLG